MVKETQDLAKKMTPDTRAQNLLKPLHSAEGRIAEVITNFSGSMTFVYLHVLIFALFFLFKPFPVEVFNIFLSLEAVFLAAFIMITQNRQALLEEYRELEEDKEEQEAEEEVEDIQKDLDDIKNAISFIQQKVVMLEKSHPQTRNTSLKQ